ncbi:S-layer homology domain-containing protein [Petrocella sp. FN5]|uniref:S-layer homology domain-containing protein n=1 Tax=Petrocella sp. FN5 TaxID=3032002 RepID=UPI0023DC557E|nr:S-layer homology domain-containing protein [Petrocella sp. FN5]MDF1616967.1 S-layer homology domain-containing protein [Petrocella sp. FN5]
MKVTKKPAKQIIGLLLLIAVMSQTLYAFTDLEPSKESTPYIEELFNRGLINGYTDGTFKPDKAITRAEFLTLINRTFGYDIESEDVRFSDVKGNEWFIAQLRITMKAGYIKGYPDGTFRPHQLISRQEVATVLNRILGYTPKTYMTTKDILATWARDDIQSLLANEIMFLQDGYFRGDVPITREDTVISLLTILHQKEALEEKEVPGLPGGGYTIINGDIPTQEIRYAMQVTVLGLDEVLSGSTKYAQKLTADHLQIVQDIQHAMTSYLADYTYDYEGAAEAVNIRYKKLTSTEQNNIKNAISASVPYTYLDTLKQFFGTK